MSDLAWRVRGRDHLVIETNLAKPLEAREVISDLVKANRLDFYGTGGGAEDDLFETRAMRQFDVLGSERGKEGNTVGYGGRGADERPAIRDAVKAATVRGYRMQRSQNVQSHRQVK